MQIYDDTVKKNSRLYFICRFDLLSFFYGNYVDK